MNDSTTPPRVLSIAGSDSSGGAGIQADLKTFTALGVYGMAAITSVTAQNTLGVHHIHDIPPDIVAAQIDAVLKDIGANVIKTGMLSNAGIVHAVAARLSSEDIPIVVDPVMISESGHALLQEDAVQTLIDELIPIAFLLTPNLAEAGVLVHGKIETEEQMREAARAIHSMGAANVLVKGGHLSTATATDILYDGDTFHEFSAPRINTKNTHGTGCTYASAIAAQLAKGQPLQDAIHAAKKYLTQAIKTAFNLGKGPGPLNHL